MRVSSLGEFALIDRLAGVLGGPTAPSLLIGIGDDGAVWAPTPDTLTVATTDALVEGVHFDLATTGWKDLGWKALAESVSDIAAMGCRPRYGLVALGMPSEHAVADLEVLYAGLGECALAFGCSVVGGDVVRAPCVMMQVTLVGESLPVQMDAGQRPVLERSAARVGDAVAVTGPLGGAAAGLRLLTEGVPAGTDPASIDALLRAHRRPAPRVAAGLTLVEAGIRCAIDVSDGLVADLGHICERSAVDAEIDVSRVPVHPGAAACFGEAALGMALAGGEDYELVCAGPPATLAVASDLLVRRGEAALVIIGSIVRQAGAEPDVRVPTSGGPGISLDRGGYRHFAPDG